MGTVLPRPHAGDGVLPRWRVRSGGLGAIELVLIAALSGLFAVGGWWLAHRFGNAEDPRRGRLPMRPHSEPEPSSRNDVDSLEPADPDGASATSRHRALAAELEQARSEAARLRRQLDIARQALELRQQHELLGRLSSGFGHDMNNLLGVISNSAHLLQRLSDAPAAQAAVAATFRSVDTATRLTQQLLQLANCRGTDMPVTDLEATLTGMHELMRVALGKRIEVSVHVAAGTRPPLVDVNQLEMALLRLMLNARSAMSGGGRLWIDACNARAEDCEGLGPGGHVAISVSDDGMGMDEDSAARAFEPFFTSGWDDQSAGLGLSEVRQFCSSAGGEARIASTPGIGTAVTLLLPSRSGPQLAGDEPTQDGAVESRRTRVLLVEDITELGDVTAALLETYGYSVLRADSAERALQMLSDDGCCDVVLSDIVMSGALDGVDLARVLRKRSPSLPVVLISGYSTAAARADGFPLLRKPCSPDLLVETLQRAMENGGTRSDRVL